MNSRYSPIAALLLTSTLPALSACGDGLGGFLISSEKEVQMGESTHASIRAEYALATADDPATKWLGEFMTPLIQGSVKFRNPDDIGGYKVAVIADDELVNAFAAPGGFVYISTGLILQSSSCAEIAGVMGHELAHVTQRHSVKTLEDQYAAQILTEWFLGEGIAQNAANILYGLVANTTFSRSHEAESDEVGLQISYNAGYNPYGLVDFFETLLSLQGTSYIPEFLSSHPATDSRITEVTAEIEKRYGNTVQPNVTQTYDCVGTSLTLEELKAHIRSGLMSVQPATGTPSTP